MKLQLILSVALFLTLMGSGQTTGISNLRGHAAGIAVLKDYDVEFMTRGYFYAGTRVEDKDAIGGFGGSDNFPRPVDASRSLPANSLSLLALPEEETTFQNDFRGMKVLLVNTTNAQVRLSASDSRLYIVQEAMDQKGRWRPIEYLPSSFCGNSYHSVFLGPKEYWEFAAAKTEGKQKTKLRFRLAISDDEKRNFIYSNVFEGGVNPKQFTVQEGHTRNGIMDPYLN